MRSASFAAGCSFSKEADQKFRPDSADVCIKLYSVLLDSLVGQPQVVDGLVGLLRLEGDTLRFRLGIDGSGWKALLDYPQKAAKATADGTAVKTLGDAAAQRRANARREAENDLLRHPE